MASSPAYAGHTGPWSLVHNRLHGEHGEWREGKDGMEVVKIRVKNVW